MNYILGYTHGHRVISLAVFYFHGGKQEECHVTFVRQTIELYIDH